MGVIVKIIVFKCVVRICHACFVVNYVIVLSWHVNLEEKITPLAIVVGIVTNGTVY